VWGGDEMTLVVPAWKGLEVMELFFQQAAAHSSFNGEMLTHKAALIFCHHNMPILQIRAIAEDLLRQTKKDIKKNIDDLCAKDQAYAGLPADRQEALKTYLSDSHGNACHILALESLDSLGGSLEKFIENYYMNTSYDNLLVYGEEIGSIRAAIATLKHELAYGQVLKLLECLQNGNAATFDAQKKRMLDLVSKNRRAQVEKAIADLVGDQPERWYLLADLWNYVTEG
jgi:hypothetical protein